MSVFTSERLSPSLDDLEKSLQNVNAMLQSTPPKPVSFIFREFLYVFNEIYRSSLSRFKHSILRVDFSSFITCF